MKAGSYSAWSRGLASSHADETERDFRARLQHAAISLGATLLGAFLGRKTAGGANVGRAATTLRAGSRTWKETQHAARAEENVAALRRQLAGAEPQFEQDVRAVESAAGAAAGALETVDVKPRKTHAR